MSNSLLLSASSGSSASTVSASPAPSKLDLLGKLEERSKSVVGSVFAIIEDLPYEKVEQLEMTVSNFKAGAITKNSAKYFFVSVLGNIAVSIVEDFLDLDLSVIKDAFAFIGNVSGLFLALGLTLDLRRAWKASEKMTPEEVAHQRATNVSKFNAIVDDLF